MAEAPRYVFEVIENLGSPDKSKSYYFADIHKAADKFKDLELSVEDAGLSEEEYMDIEIESRRYQEFVEFMAGPLYCAFKSGFTIDNIEPELLEYIKENDYEALLDEVENEWLKDVR